MVAKISPAIKRAIPPIATALWNPDDKVEVLPRDMVFPNFEVGIFSLRDTQWDITLTNFGGNSEFQSGVKIAGDINRSP
jgi:hypothetical protein